MLQKQHKPNQGNWTTLAKSSSYFGIHIGDSGVRISVLLAATRLPTAPVVRVILGAAIPSGNSDSKFAEAVGTHQTISKWTEFIIL